MAVVRYYVKENNPEGASFPGVPLGDLTEEEFAALPEWLQKSVDASTFYRKTSPATASRKPADKHEET